MSQRVDIIRDPCWRNMMSHYYAVIDPEGKASSRATRKWIEEQTNCYVERGQGGRWLWAEFEEDDLVVFRLTWSAARAKG